MLDDIVYPQARRGTVVEHHFGTRVPDPYRWLEDPDSDETKAFVDAQNSVSNRYLDTPLRKRILNALTKFQDYPKFETPFKRGNFWYSWRNSGLQNQSVLHKHVDQKGEQSEVFLDPNAWAEDGTAAIGQYKFTNDGSLLAYARSDNGSDWCTIYFVEVATGRQLEDRLQHAKFTSLEWVGNKHIFYNRYDLEEGRDASGLENVKDEFHKLYCHELGTPQEDDVLVLEFPDEPKWMANIDVTGDEDFLVAAIGRSCEPVNQLWIAQLPAPGSPTKAYGALEWKKISENFDAEYSYVANDNSVFLFYTNLDAPKYRLVRVDIKQPGVPMIGVVPEADAVLEGAHVVAGDKLMLQYMEDVKSRLYVHRLDGKRVKELDIPLGAVRDVSGERKYNHFLFTLSSFNTPSIIFEVDVEGGSYDVRVMRRTQIEGLPLDLLDVTQEFYTGKDGTKIPMFLMRRKDMRGSQPTMLYGYGGFNVTLLPFFSVGFALAALFLGLALAIPNIRGGGEYGIKWYKAAVQTQKQVSYDDFIRAAEHLLEKGYSSPEKLAIMGASNGGLLVGACANQRPDLFRAVVARVGVMDLTRFHKFTIGHAWTSDYGNPEDEEDFKSIIKISPLHNINPDVVRSTKQPAVLVMTADHDDRVSPCHSLKYIAELQHSAGYSSPASRPLIASIDIQAGHGKGKPLGKILDEQSRMYGFIAKVLGLEWSDPPAEK